MSNRNQSVFVVMIGVLSGGGGVGVPVVGIDVEKLAKIVSATVAESDGVGRTLVDAISKRGITTVELDCKFVI